MVNKIKISDIIISPNRQRKELVDIEELAASIEQHGLLQPVVLADDNTLIAGGRRIAAHQHLNRTEIEYVSRPDLSPADLELLEYIENAMRVDLEWQDKCEAIRKYHAMRKEAEPTATNETIAAELCLAKSTLGQYLMVSSYLEERHEQVMEAPKFSTARNIAQRAEERRSSARMESLGDSISEVILGTTAVETTEEGPVFASEPPKPIEAKIEAPFENVSFIDWAPAYTGPKFNLIHCDFPYGINADKHAQGAAREYTGYSDSAEVYWNLIEALGAAMDNVVAGSAHLIFWFSMTNYESTKQALTDMGWKVNPMPLIWHKNDNSGIIPDPNRGPRQIYETAFLASRGDRYIVRPVANVQAFPNVKTRHMSQKNTSMLEGFLRMLVDNTTKVLDPTCGSGSAIFAAANLGASSYLGLEVDYRFYESTVEAWSAREETLEFDL